MFQVDYSERSRRTRYNAKFRTRTTDVVFSLVPAVPQSNFSVIDVIKGIRDAINGLIKSSLDHIAPEDKVWLVLSHKELDKPISVPMVKREDLTSDLLCDRVMKVAQSKKELLFHGLLSLSVMSTSLPQGGGGRNGKRSKDSVIDFTAWRKNSTCVIRVEESGNDCLPRAICISKAKCDGMKGNEFDYLKRNRRHRLDMASSRLCKDAGVTLGPNGAVYDDLVKFQECLRPDYQLIVATPSGGNDFYYRGIPAEKQIFVIYNDNHYDSLTSIKAFLKVDYWCRYCLKGFVNTGEHRCSFTCPRCFGSDKCIGEEQLVCQECNRTFVSKTCFDRHRNETKVCGRYFYCLRCKTEYSKKAKHVCQHYYCKTCAQQVRYGHHKCYMQPLDKIKLKDEDHEPRVHIFYDIESMFDRTNPHEVEHKPNLVVSQTCCSLCWQNLASDKCELCGWIKMYFYGLNAVKKFSEWLFGEYEFILQANCKELGIKQVIDCNVFAHNARSYDAILVMNYLLSSRRKPSVIKKGQKIITMRVGRYKFLDSIAFLAMPLRNFADTFGLETGKGLFPYLFNIRENQDYVGQWPDRSFYSPEDLKGKDLETFNKWYAEQQGKTFNLKEELIRYCQQDVDVLMKGVQCFQKLLIDTAGIDPFTRNLTLSSYVMSVFRASYLPERTLAVPPATGYEPKKQHSHIATLWLDYLEQTEGISIDREVQLGHFYADGYNTETRQVYEFFGCYFHGCFKCFPTKRNVTMNNVSGLSMSQLAEGVKKKLGFYESNNWNVTYVYECELHDQLKACPAMQQFFKERINKVRKPIDVRDAYYGGRVETIKFLHEAKFGEKIMYYDINSLYPYILKSRQFPQGHPKIIHNNFGPLDTYEGLIQAKILPPRGLFHPLLPAHVNDKLMYVLCRKCAEECADSLCYHNEEDRSISGTWVLAEVKKAIELGYNVLEIFCVWHFDQFATDEDGNNVFKPFINKWLKIKLQASGWPKANMSFQERKEYIDMIKTCEDIDLDESQIVKRKDLRTIGKQCANIFYGKMGEKSIRSQTKFINEPSEYFALLGENTIEINDVIFVNDEMLQVTYVTRSEFVQVPPHASVIQACYVTAYARLHLYSFLEQLQERVFYMDTDSVVFSYQPGDSLPESGMLIGQMSDEIKGDFGDQAFIKRFCSIGCKSYCMEIIDGSANSSYINKFKGITCKFATSYIINFQNIMDIISDKSISYSVPQKRFKISKEYSISTQDFMKKLQFTFDKRRIVDQCKTEPFGY